MHDDLVPGQGAEVTSRIRFYHWLEAVAVRSLLRARLIFAGRASTAADTGSAQILRRALHAALESAPPELVRWQSVIEELRGRLLASTARLTGEDFRAGSKGSSAWGAEVTARPRSGAIAEVCALSSKSPIWGRILFHLVREFRPDFCLELGTSLGLSAAYIGAALAENGNGQMATLEGAVPLAVVARRNLSELGLDTVQVVTGVFDQTLPEVLAKNHSVDFAFIDGHHDGRATLGYFERILSASARSVVFVFDDIRWSADMHQAWRTIKKDDRVTACFDLTTTGVVLVERPAHGGAEQPKSPA